MSPSEPRLSLCVVVRNAAQDLNRTLASFQVQLSALHVLRTQIVVVDGESTDGSLQIAERWLEAAGLPGTCLSQPPRGIYPAMNLAWQQASGEWLLFINAGDLLLDAGGLSQCLDAADRDAIDSLQCRAGLFPPGSGWAAVPRAAPVSCHQSLVYRRHLHQSLGPYDERLALCSDLLLIRAIERGHHRHVPLLLAATVVSPANSSRTSRRVRQDLARLCELHIGLRPWPAPWKTMLVLQVEEWLGVSFTVWIRIALGLLRGTSRLVRLPDGTH